MYSATTDNRHTPIILYMHRQHCATIIMHISALAVFSRNALYKSTFYLLTYLHNGDGPIYVHQTFKARRPCLPSDLGTCMEQPAVVCQECTVADDVSSRAEDRTLSVVV